MRSLVSAQEYKHRTLQGSDGAGHITTDTCARIIENAQQGGSRKLGSLQASSAQILRYAPSQKHDPDGCMTKYSFKF